MDSVIAKKEASMGAQETQGAFSPTPTSQQKKVIIDIDLYRDTAVIRYLEFPSAVEIRLKIMKYNSAIVEWEERGGRPHATYVAIWDINNVGWLFEKGGNIELEKELYKIETIMVGLRLEVVIDCSQG